MPLNVVRRLTPTAGRRRGRPTRRRGLDSEGGRRRGAGCAPPRPSRIGGRRRSRREGRCPHPEGSRNAGVAIWARSRRRAGRARAKFARRRRLRQVQGQRRIALMRRRRWPPLETANGRNGRRPGSRGRVAEHLRGANIRRDRFQPDHKLGRAQGRVGHPRVAPFLGIRSSRRSARTPKKHAVDPESRTHRIFRTRGVVPARGPQGERSRPLQDTQDAPARRRTKRRPSLAESTVPGGSRKTENLRGQRVGHEGK